MFFFIKQESSCKLSSKIFNEDQQDVTILYSLQDVTILYSLEETLVREPELRSHLASQDRYYYHHELRSHLAYHHELRSHFA